VVGEVVPLVDSGLGNSSYLGDLGDGRALVVDASGDLRVVDAATAQSRLRVVAAATPTCCRATARSTTATTPFSATDRQWHEPDLPR
jgi:hypothetical protein